MARLGNDAGDAVTMVLEDVGSVSKRLCSLTTYNYFRSKGMPAFAEPLITEFVESFARWSDVDRQKAITVWRKENGDQASDTLGWYARKMAGRAVREGSQQMFKNGLVAIGIAASAGDLRDNFAVLSLLSRTASKLGLHCTDSPCAKALSGTPEIEAILTFMARAPADRAIERFGFSEGQGPFGFDYLPLLVEDGGPSPF